MTRAELHDDYDHALAVVAEAYARLKAAEVAVDDARRALNEAARRARVLRTLVKCSLPTAGAKQKKGTGT